MREPLEIHSHEIFEKGYVYLTSHIHETPAYAITKSINGLQRFLDLPIEFFSAADTRLTLDGARTLRLTCSAMVGGILTGYCQARIGVLTGSEVLAKYPRSWVHSLAFLTDGDLATLLAVLASSDLRDGIRGSVRPVVQALDDLSARGRDYVPLAALAQMVWDSRRLEISIQPPPYATDPQLMDIQCYLDGSFVRRQDLEEAANRRVGAVVAPLRPDLRAIVASSDRLRNIVVPAAVDESQLAATRQSVVSTLEYAVYTRRSPREGAQPLQYNFAREFPLHNPFLTRYFHVHRSSVVELLRTFERRNGVRLWCSVRRSGKTTACADLASTTGQSTGPHPDL